MDERAIYSLLIPFTHVGGNCMASLIVWISEVVTEVIATAIARWVTEVLAEWVMYAVREGLAAWVTAIVSEMVLLFSRLLR
jgi:hypothetical protein